MMAIFLKFTEQLAGAEKIQTTTRNRFALPACRHRRSAGRAAASLHAEAQQRTPFGTQRIGLNDRRKSLHRCPSRIQGLAAGGGASSSSVESSTSAADRAPLTSKAAVPPLSRWMEDHAQGASLPFRRRADRFRAVFRTRMRSTASSPAPACARPAAPQQRTGFCRSA